MSLIKTYTYRDGEHVGPKGSSLGRSGSIKKTGARKKRQSSEEKAFKASVRQRDLGLCQRCGCCANQVHHLLTVGAHVELQFTAANCLTLCGRCHKSAADSAHKDPAKFNRWAADTFPRFVPLYLQFGKGDLYEAFAAKVIHERAFEVGAVGLPLQGEGR